MFLKPPFTLTHIDGIFSSNITSCVLGSSSFRKRSWLTMFFLVLGVRTRTLSVIHTSMPSSISPFMAGVSPPRKKGFFRISSSGCDSRYCILSSITQSSCSEKKKGQADCRVRPPMCKPVMPDVTLAWCSCSQCRTACRMPCCRPVRWCSEPSLRE